MPLTNLMPQPRLAPAPGLVSVDGRTFPLKSAAIQARAEGGVAATTLVQTYENSYPEPLEVLYTLPLPADGSVIGYTIQLGEKRITGEVEKREVAWKKYRKALEEGRTGGLLDQERSDTFTQTLGNLPPGATARIEIEILQPLAFRPAAGNLAPEWEYRFPTVVGVRYQGGPGRVPDREKLDVHRANGNGTPVRLDLDLLVADGLPERISPRSESHQLAVKSEDGGSRVAFRQGVMLDRDVAIRWKATGNEVGIVLREGRGLPGDDGRYGIITLTPPTAPRETFARDLTILIDASGSMHGEPIRRAKILAANLLESLDRRDRFELLAFAMGVETLVGGPVEATPGNINQALGCLEQLEAGGGTEMASAIVHALKPLRPDSQRQVILLTDGYIGFEHEVIGNVLRNLPEGARLHTVGIGHAPNRSLTRFAARAGRGVELIATTDEETKATAERLRQATVGPVLTDVAVKGIALEAHAPERLRDVLAGQPLVVAVQLSPEGGSLEVSGRLVGRNEPWIRTLDVAQSGASSEKPHLPLGALFGREAIDDREMRLAAASEQSMSSMIEQQIETLGLRHRITSRRTSLVAISEDPTVDPKDPRRRERLAVELPAEVSAEGVGLVYPELVSKLYTCRIMPLTSGDSILEPKLAPESSASYISDYAPSADFKKKVRRPWFKPAFVKEKLAVARVIRLEGDTLVIEFESPVDGFRLPAPSDRITVHSENGERLETFVVEDLSTRPGPHPAGLTLRLALRVYPDDHWRNGVAALYWPADVGDEPQVWVNIAEDPGDTV